MGLGTKGARSARAPQRRVLHAVHCESALCGNTIFASTLPLRIVCLSMWLQKLHFPFNSRTPPELWWPGIFVFFIHKPQSVT